MIFTRSITISLALNMRCNGCNDIITFFKYYITVKKNINAKQNTKKKQRLLLVETYINLYIYKNDTKKLMFCKKKKKIEKNNEFEAKSRLL